jgi:hypothetical protein
MGGFGRDRCYRMQTSHTAHWAPVEALAMATDLAGLLAEMRRLSSSSLSGKKPLEDYNGLGNS